MISLANSKKSQQACLEALSLASLLFNIFINDLFLFIETTTLGNYADDNTMYFSDKNANIVMSRLRHAFAIISEWFYENYMDLNADKCHFLTVGLNEPLPDFSFNDTTVENIIEEKILGIVIDKKLNFKSHLKNTCKKANQKLSALSKLATLNQWNKMVIFFH